MTDEAHLYNTDTPLYPRDTLSSAPGMEGKEGVHFMYITAHRVERTDLTHSVRPSRIHGRLSVGFVDADAMSAKPGDVTNGWKIRQESQSYGWCSALRWPLVVMGDERMFEDANLQGKAHVKCLASSPNTLEQAV